MNPDELKEMLAKVGPDEITLWSEKIDDLSKSETISVSDKTGGDITWTSSSPIYIHDDDRGWGHLSEGTYYTVGGIDPTVYATASSVPEIKDVKSDAVIEAIRKCKGKTLSDEVIEEVVKVLQDASEATVVLRNLRDSIVNISTEMTTERYDLCSLKTTPIISTTIKVDNAGSDAPFVQWLRKGHKY